MAALNPRLIVQDYPAGVQGVLVPLGTRFSVGSILGIPGTLPPPPSTSSASPTVHTVINGPVAITITRKLSAPEDISYRANGQDAATYLTPGVAPPGTRIIVASLDGGTQADARLLSTGSQITNNYPIEVSETGVGIGKALTTTRIGRWTAQQVTLASVFNGQKGSISTADVAHIATPNGILPDLAGWASIPIGLPGSQQAAALTHTFVVGASVASVLLDVDANRDTILDGVQAIAERLGGAIGDATLAQFVLDSSDHGPAGGAVTLTLGHKSSAPVLTFDGVSTGPGTVAPILRGTQGQPQVADMFASCSFQGGDTHHGVPDGGKFTDIVTLNHLLSDATGDYRSGLPVLAHYINRDQGGVYYWPGDGTLHAMSQAMGVSCLWYDESTHTLYAGTDLGVYTLPADPAAYRATQQWARLGAMALKVIKLVKDSGTLYALVEWQHTGARHILQYPAAMGTPDQTINGYGGWSNLSTVAGIFDFSVCQGSLYCLANSNPAFVLRSQIGSSANPTTLPLTTGDPNTGPVPTGLDPILDTSTGATVIGTYVRSTSGASGLFWIAGNSSTLLSAGFGLKDDSGLPLMVNRIGQHPAGVIQWDKLQPKVVQLWAATNQGVFLCGSLAGNAWHPTMGQSALGDVNVLQVVSGPPRAWLGQMQTHVYGLTDTSLYYSPDGTVHWEDMFARQLDVGPLFYALWKKQYGTYPDNVDTGSQQSSKPLLYPDPVRGPFNLVRMLDGVGLFDYILYNWLSQAPAGAHKDHTLAQISTPALVPELTAAKLLGDAMARFLAFTAAPQQIIEIESKFDDDADPLRFLQPTQQVLVNGPIAQCLGGSVITYVDYANLVCYVLEHEITIDADQDPTTATTKTRVGTILLDDRSDPNKLGGDLEYQLDRAQRYKVRGHH